MVMYSCVHVFWILNVRSTAKVNATLPKLMQQKGRKNGLTWRKEIICSQSYFDCKMWHNDRKRCATMLCAEEPGSACCRLQAGRLKNGYGKQGGCIGNFFWQSKCNHPKYGIFPLQPGIKYLWGYLWINLFPEPSGIIKVSYSHESHSPWDAPKRSLKALR